MRNRLQEVEKQIRLATCIRKQEDMQKDEWRSAGKLRQLVAPR
jgi:hypothetical protein